MPGIHFRLQEPSQSPPSLSIPENNPEIRSLKDSAAEPGIALKEGNGPHPRIEMLVDVLRMNIAIGTVDVDAVTVIVIVAYDIAKSDSQL
jgi:hypothetical protein